MKKLEALEPSSYTKRYKTQQQQSSLAEFLKRQFRDIRVMNFRDTDASLIIKQKLPGQKKAMLV